MRAVVQRVKFARLSVNGELISEIGFGMLALVGVGLGDTEKDALYLADKLSKLRIFEDQSGKINLSANDVGAEVLIVSNFTLYGSTKGTNRPDFAKAQKPPVAKQLFDCCADKLAERVKTKRGVFGAEMAIDMCADGPVTIFIESNSEGV